MREIISAKYLEEYKLLVTFESGEVKIVDLEESLWGEVFEPLRDLTKFKQFRIEWGTLTWLEGQADFAPEFLYDKGIKTTGHTLKKYDT